MHSSIGKPLVALVSAACLAAPAMTPTPHHSGITQSSIPVELSAAVSSFDPLPASARSLVTTVAPTDPATLAGAVDTMAALSGQDSGLLLLKLLSAPYHNFASISIAVGKAVNAGIQVVSLPFSILTYVIANKPDDIPAYITQVQNNLKAAIPGIGTAIKSEIAYDKDLIQQVFGGGATAMATNAKETPNLLAVESSSPNVLGATPNLLTAAQDQSDTAGDATPHRETWKERIAAKKAAKDETASTDESASTDSTGKDASSSTDTAPTKESTPTTEAGTDTGDAPTAPKHRLGKPAGDKAGAAESTGGKHRKPETDSGADAA